MKVRQLAPTIFGTLISFSLLVNPAGAATEGTESEPASAAPAAEQPEKIAPACSDSKSICKIECTEPLASCSESEKVIETLKLLADAYARGDLTTYEAYLDDGCTTFDEETKKLIVGKQAVLEHLKHRFQEFAPDGKKPLMSYRIEHPYANVTGDTAVVTFVAGVQVGGKNPYKAENHVTDIFVKHGDKWKKLHYRGRWRKVG